VVHGKRSLIEKMPGDDWQKFANLRAYLAFMWCHPGKKLLFMGCEFAQRREWNHDSSLDWQLLQHESHAGMQQLVKDLNALYFSESALYSLDPSPEGFEWIDVDNHADSIFIFARYDELRQSLVVAAVNMTPMPHLNYRIGVPKPGLYAERINTDSQLYGGSDMGNLGRVESQEISSHGRQWSVNLTLPPLATVILKHQ
jgi:1,4-alpha-glucan branching enzyme